MRKRKFRRPLREILIAILRLASRDKEADFFASLSDIEMDRWFFRTAVHEAGHAVVAIKTGIGLRSVSIVPRSDRGVVHAGVTLIPKSERSLLSRIAGKGESAALPLVAFLIAGSLSEQWVDGRFLADSGHLVDYKSAAHVLAVALCGRAPVSKARRTSKMPEIEVAVKNAITVEARALAGCQPAVRRIANVLMEKRRLTGDEVIAIIDGCDRNRAAKKRVRRYPAREGNRDVVCL